MIVLGKLVPTECSIIISFEVVGVYLNSILIVVNGIIKLPFLSVGESTIMVKISLAGFDVNSLCKALDCLVIVTFSIETDPLIIISVSVVGVNLNCRGVIVYGFLEFADLIICETTIEKSFEMVWHDL